MMPIISVLFLTLASNSFALDACKDAQFSAWNTPEKKIELAKAFVGLTEINGANHDTIYTGQLLFRTAKKDLGAKLEENSKSQDLLCDGSGKANDLTEPIIRKEAEDNLAKLDKLYRDSFLAPEKAQPAEFKLVLGALNGDKESQLRFDKDKYVAEVKGLSCQPSESNKYMAHAVRAQEIWQEARTRAVDNYIFAIYKNLVHIKKQSVLRKTELSFLNKLRNRLNDLRPEVAANKGDLNFHLSALKFADQLEKDLSTKAERHCKLRLSPKEQVLTQPPLKPKSTMIPPLK